MKVSRRAFSKGCAMAATGLAIGEALPALAQVEGEHINTSHASILCLPFRTPRLPHKRTSA